MFLVKATYDFKGEDERDLTFIKGDVLEVTEEQDGWYTGFRTQDPLTIGDFPINRTEKMEDKPKPVLKGILDEAASNAPPTPEANGGMVASVNASRGKGGELEFELNLGARVVGDEGESEDDEDGPATNEDEEEEDEEDEEDEDEDEEDEGEENEIEEDEDDEQDSDEDPLNQSTEEETQAAIHLQAAVRGYETRAHIGGSKKSSNNKSRRSVKETFAADSPPLTVSPQPPGKAQVDQAQVKTIAKLVDARLASEFEKREEALVEMQKTMSKMRMQLQIQSNNWRQFMARNKGKRKTARHTKLLKKSADGGGDSSLSPQPPTGRRGSAIARFESYDFDPSLPRVAKIKKKKPGELNEIDLHRAAAANSVVRYAESRSAVYEPSDFDSEKTRTDPPGGTLTLEHVHGFSGKIATNTNALWLKSGEIVFPASAAVVIMDTESNTQRFFLEHDDDVMALAVHPKVDIVASGQLTRKAFVLVYDVTQSNPDGISFINELNLGVNTRGVKCLDFSPDGELLLSIAADPYHTVSIWDWKRNNKLASARANNADVYCMRFSPYQNYSRDTVPAHECEYTLVSHGSRHIKFWTLEPDDSVVVEGAKDEKEARALAQRLGKWKIEANAASFGTKAKMQDIMCCTFVLDTIGDLPNDVAPSGRILCGTESGSIFVFSTMEEPREEEDHFGKNPTEDDDDDEEPKVNKPVKWAARGALINVIKDAHKGVVLDISAAGGSNIVASVAKDCLLKLWQLSSVDEGDSLTLRKSISVVGVGPLLGTPRSIRWSHALDKIIVGTSGNSLVECSVSGISASLEGAPVSKVNIVGMDCVVKGHANSIKQVACHPSEAMYASVGDDRSLNLWSSEENRLISSLRMPDKIMSISFHPNGEHIAVGLINGDVYVKAIPDSEDGDWRTTMMKKTGNNVKKELGGAWQQARGRKAGKAADSETEDESGVVGKLKNEKKDIKHSVNKILYSPDGRTLVAACRDYFLYVFDVDAGYKKVAIMKGHSTFVTHMDFSTDSRVLQSNDAAREILYWDVNVGKQLANSFDLRDTVWSTWTCVFGWSVQGIWEENAGGEQNVLSVARSIDGQVVATGDDNNMINLFRYPALKGSHCKAFGGHMCPVVSLSFSADNSKMLSTGGQDACIFQWSYEGSNR